VKVRCHSRAFREKDSIETCFRVGAPRRRAAGKNLESEKQAIRAFLLSRKREGKNEEGTEKA